MIANEKPGIPAMGKPTCDNLVGDTGLNGIFLLHEGLPKTVFDSQVVKHVEMMRDAGVHIDVWAYALTKVAYLEAREKLALLRQEGIPVRLSVGIWKYLPFSELLNSLLLAYHLRKSRLNPDFIHCRTEYSASVAGYVKLTRPFRLIWDVRGDSESELLMNDRDSTLKRAVKKVYRYLLRLRIHWSARQADAVIFVSDKLRDLVRQRHHGYEHAVIPCVADEKTFFFDPSIREKMRTELGIDESEPVFIYSGSMAPWQCFEETVALIEQLLATVAGSKALILSPYAGRTTPHLARLPQDRAIVRSVPFGEVNAYLNAADYALFLRRDNPVNRVASPVKFAEYALAGLPVIMTEAVHQSAQLARRLGNFVHYEFDHPPALPAPLSSENRAALAGRAKAMLSREAFRETYLEMYGTGHRDGKDTLTTDGT